MLRVVLHSSCMRERFALSSDFLPHALAAYVCVCGFVSTSISFFLRFSNIYDRYIVRARTYSVVWEFFRLADSFVSQYLILNSIFSLSFYKIFFSHGSVLLLMLLLCQFFLFLYRSGSSPPTTTTTMKR